MFKNKNLAVLAYAQHSTLWNYITQDPLYTVEQPGYFNEIKRLAYAGDKIIVLTIFEYCEYVITSVEKDVVIKQLTPVIALSNKPCELAKNCLGQFQKPISKIGDMAHIALKEEQKETTNDK